jgi:hypothetical protein
MGPKTVKKDIKKEKTEDIPALITATEEILHTSESFSFANNVIEQIVNNYYNDIRKKDLQKQIRPVASRKTYITIRTTIADQVFKKSDPKKDNYIISDELADDEWSLDSKDAPDRIKQ